MVPEYFNNSVKIDGKIYISIVPNSQGTILTYNEATKEISQRTNTELLSDLGLKFSHKTNFSGGLNNASDSNVNKSWFDYSWANSGFAGSVINFSGLGSGNYSTELFVDYGSGLQVGTRSRNGDAAAWNPINWIWHSRNFNPADYTTISQLSNYVTINTPQTIIANKTFAGAIGNQYYEAAMMVNGNGSTIYPTVGFHQPGVLGATLSVRNDGSLYFNNNIVWNTGNFNPANYATTTFVNTNFLPIANLQDEIINNGGDLRLNPKEYRVDNTLLIEINDKKRLIHVINPQGKSTVDLLQTYPKQEYTFYNLDVIQSLDIQVNSVSIVTISGGKSRKLYITEDLTILSTGETTLEIL